ncbi:MAG: zinc-ribbon domain-containing protein [Clostridium sp.]|nr:zinc-ribbon domain-containing protein [Clostridium sp.]MCM1443927.1 zinc-ribbon domain-containing protein [Candidatus Amulumruptor caecigallinarius]
MEDKKIVCSDCGNEFTFTVGEQEFYKEKGFNDPQRCKECRDKRKAQKNENNK